MESLVQLIKFVGPKKLRQTSILDDKNGETKLHKLYQAINSGKHKDEESIAQTLFGIPSNGPVFRQLKSKLKTRLVNNLFLLEPNEAQFKSYSNAFQNCRKLFFASEILYSKGARGISITLAEKAFRMAEKFQFSDLAELSATFLRSGYRMAGDKSKMKFYRDQAKIYYQKYLSEKNIKLIRENLIEDLYLNRGLSKDDVDYINEQELELRNLLQQNESPFSIVFGYGALCIIDELRHDFQNIINISEVALEKLSEYSFLPSIYLVSFYSNILTSAIALENFQKGKKVVEKLNQNLKIIHGLNRLYLTKNFMVLSFRTANYYEALKLFNETKNQPIWRKAPVIVKEEWDLFGAYLFFLSSINKLEVPEDSFKGFRMGRFFNSITQINKDKVGYNLALLILQIIYFLTKKNYDLVLDHIESLGAYNYRYLRKDESARSQYFVKMLLTLSDGNFHLAAVQRKSKKWLVLLNNEKSSISSEGLRSEFIPFNVLWEIILNGLDSKINRAKKNRS